MPFDTMTGTKVQLIAVSALVMALAVRPADGARVLVFQMDMPYPNSHYLMLTKIIKELGSRGHNVMVR
jgi:hypothetical protein